MTDTEPSFIPLADCVPRHVYELRSRNLLVGAFNPATRGFIGIRTKFNSTYLFTEFHYEASPVLGTAQPISDLGELPAGIRLWESYPQQSCANCGEQVESHPLGDTPTPVEWRHHHTDLPPPECDEAEPRGGGTYGPLFAELEDHEDDLRDHVERMWFDDEIARQHLLDDHGVTPERYVYPGDRPGKAHNFEHAGFMWTDGPRRRLILSYEQLLGLGRLLHGHEVSDDMRTSLASTVSNELPSDALTNED